MAKPGCPSCDGRGFSGFNWEYASQASDHEICKYPKYLKHEFDLRIGQLYYCPFCDQRWFLDDDREFMSIVPRDRLQYVEKWNNKSLQFSDEDLAQLKAIGATPSGIGVFGNGKGTISIPCEVTDKLGNIYKKAIICFQSGPPISRVYERWHFSDEIDSFRASEFCLSQEVRVATSQSDEVRMGFSPTKVQDIQGNQYLLNWTTNFFDYNGVKGSDIILSDAVTKERPPIINESYFDVEFFIADYSRDLEFLYIDSDSKKNCNKLMQRIKKIFAFFAR